jgi:cytochrome c553
MFARYDEFRMEDVAARRGCTDCHDPAGPFSLKNEAVNAVDIAPHTGLPNDAGLNTCLGCHAMEADGTGNLATISMRDIVHPVHMGSKIFAWELMGNCFSCHNVDAEGEFDVLPEGLATDEDGIPDAIPIATQQDPVGP